MIYKKLHLFSVSGATFTFFEAEITADNETTLAFTYRAQSDETTKSFVASKANLVGYSVTK